MRIRSITVEARETVSLPGYNNVSRSRLMSKRCQCDAEPEECEVLQDLGTACETHGCVGPK